MRIPFFWDTMDNGVATASLLENTKIAVAKTFCQLSGVAQHLDWRLSLSFLVYSPGFPHSTECTLSSLNPTSLHPVSLHLWTKHMLWTIQPRTN